VIPNSKGSTAEATSIGTGVCTMDLRVVILAMIQIVVAFFDDRMLDSSTIDDIIPISENMHLKSVVAHTRARLESSSSVNPRGVIDHRHQYNRAI
jgi:hypothetical protein